MSWIYEEREKVREGLEREWMKKYEQKYKSLRNDLGSDDEEVVKEAENKLHALGKQLNELVNKEVENKHPEIDGITYYNDIVISAKEEYLTDSNEFTQEAKDFIINKLRQIPGFEEAEYFPPTKEYVYVSGHITAFREVLPGGRYKADFFEMKPSRKYEEATFSPNKFSFSLIEDPKTRNQLDSIVTKIYGLNPPKE